MREVSSGQDGVEVQFRKPKTFGGEGAVSPSLLFFCYRYISMSVGLVHARWEFTVGGIYAVQMVLDTVAKTNPQQCSSFFTLDIDERTFV